MTGDTTTVNPDISVWTFFILIIIVFYIDVYLQNEVEADEGAAAGIAERRPVSTFKLALPWRIS